MAKKPDPFDEAQLNNPEVQKQVFEDAFRIYWNELKPLARRLIDNESKEKEICAMFFEAMTVNRNKYLRDVKHYAKQGMYDGT